MGSTIVRAPGRTSSAGHAAVRVSSCESRPDKFHARSCHSLAIRPRRVRMPRQSRAGGTLPVVHIDAASPVPLYEQLYSGLRERIVSGHLPPGTRLASTRALASELGLSRFTVVTAINQLTSEGYLTSSARGGTFVARALPERTMRVSRQARPAPRRGAPPLTSAAPNAGSVPALSGRGRALA